MIYFQPGRKFKEWLIWEVFLKDTLLKWRKKNPTQLQKDHFPAKYFRCWNLSKHRKLFSSNENTDFINLVFCCPAFYTECFLTTVGIKFLNAELYHKLETGKINQLQQRNFCCWQSFIWLQAQDVRLCLTNCKIIYTIVVSINRIFNGYEEVELEDITIFITWVLSGFHRA